jgi:hypothetical protein
LFVLFLNLGQAHARGPRCIHVKNNLEYAADRFVDCEMRDNQNSPQSSLSDDNDEINSAKTSTYVSSAGNSSAVQSSGGNSFAGHRVELE